jgi:RNA polymerase sigma-70 factor (ECF subfamily)
MSPVDTIDDFLNSHYDLALRAAVRMLACRGLADRVAPEDIAHNALLRAWSRASEIDSPSEGRWLVYNAVRSEVRNLTRGWWQRMWDSLSRNAGDDPEPWPDRHAVSPEEWASRKEIALRVHTVLEKLSEPHREALCLCDLEGLTDSEAARILGLSLGTLKSRKARARENFYQYKSRFETGSPGVEHD